MKKYENTRTGIVISVNSPIKGENWVEVAQPKQSIDSLKENVTTGPAKKQTSKSTKKKSSKTTKKKPTAKKENKN